MKGKGYKPYREIAQDIPLKSHQTFANWMKSDFPGVYRAMGREPVEEFTSKDNGGARTVDMPSLWSRDVDLAFHDLLCEAKQADNELRWTITQRLRSMLQQLEVEAPCSEPVEDF